MRAKKPSVYVNEAVAQMYRRMAIVAAHGAVENASNHETFNVADRFASKATEWAERAGGNAIRGYDLK